MSNPNPARGAKRPTGKTSPFGDARMTDSRESWVECNRQSFILFVGHDQDWLDWKEAKGDPVTDYDPEHPPMRIEIRLPGRRTSTVIPLSASTVEELTTLREFLNRAIDMALPISEYYDRRALDAFQNEGDTSYARLYRPIPKLFVRERLLAEHGQSVQERSERLDEGIAAGKRNLPDIDGGNGDSAGGPDEDGG